MLISRSADSENNHGPTLFPLIRARYQRFVEEILGSEQVSDTGLSDFKARHDSCAFLCRYPNCPRALQGYKTLELRQTHEKSHKPRFRCAEATCGFFGSRFSTRAAAKRHAAQYHDEERTASIPDSLGEASRRSQQDRSLFTLKACYSVDESQPRKSTQNGHTGISIDEQDVRFSDESASVQETTNVQQDSYLATEGSSVTDVEIGLASLTLKDIPADLKQVHDDWHVIHNPNLQRRTSVELIYDVNHSDHVVSLCFSPDDTLIAIAIERDISIFDVSTGALVERPGGHLSSDCITDVQFSPCNNNLAFCCSYSPLGVSNISSCAAISKLTAVSVMGFRDLVHGPLWERSTRHEDHKLCY